VSATGDARPMDTTDIGESAAEVCFSLSVSLSLCLSLCLSPPAHPSLSHLLCLVQELSRLQGLLAAETEKFAAWKDENIRRRHNYVPFIMVNTCVFLVRRVP
jgi:hypothetical protein